MAALSTTGHESPETTLSQIGQLSATFDHLADQGTSLADLRERPELYGMLAVNCATLLLEQDDLIGEEDKKRKKDLLDMIDQSRPEEIEIVKITRSVADTSQVSFIDAKFEGTDPNVYSGFGIDRLGNIYAFVSTKYPGNNINQLGMQTEQRIVPSSGQNSSVYTVMISQDDIPQEATEIIDNFLAY
jgi:hypothetical protein